MLDNVAGARARAERGELAFGTIDSFLLWRLTGGQVHATDVTNASRTMLFDIHRAEWDEELLRLIRVPRAMLPEVKDSSALMARPRRACSTGRFPIGGIAGDQQAALIGQACFEPGMIKSTYGTGCFLLLNTGETAVLSRHRLLTTPAYRIGGRTTYAIEGSIFVAGAAIKWLRDGLGIIKDAAETAALAMQVPDSHGVYMVPAFVGLGAPHWEPSARGLICGLTLDATGAHLARAALESVAFQTLDLAAADGRRWRAGRGGDSRRRRHGGQRLVLPVPRRRGQRARQAPDAARDDGARRGVPRRTRDRRLAGPEGRRRDLGNRCDIHAGHCACAARGIDRRVEECAAADAFPVVRRRRSIRVLFVIGNNDLRPPAVGLAWPAIRCMALVTGSDCNNPHVQ